MIATYDMNTILTDHSRHILRMLETALMSHGRYQIRIITKDTAPYHHTTLHSITQHYTSHHGEVDAPITT